LLDPVIFRGVAGVCAVEREKRKQQRIHIALPVFLKNTTGVTRDVSATGVFFWTGIACVTGDFIWFEVELRRPVGKMKLKCQGDVVRTEASDSTTGVAVRITQSSMEQS